MKRALAGLEASLELHGYIEGAVTMAIVVAMAVAMVLIVAVAVAVAVAVCCGSDSGSGSGSGGGGKAKPLTYMKKYKQNLLRRQWQVTLIGTGSTVQSTERGEVKELLLPHEQERQADSWKHKKLYTQQLVT